ncbi:MAG: hypothetical protein HY869_02220 [Chloroflexi bacterium]|nr:hypothetical protein [Chloroflexota bacterium]
MKNSITILFVIILAGCGNLPISNAPQSPIASPVINTSIPFPQTTLQNTYHNSKYGYSLNYPDTYNIVIVSDEFVEIGSKITIEVMNVDPTAPRGDGAVIENTSDIQFSGYPAKLLTGYIGSVGG